MRVLLGTPFMSSHYDSGLFFARALSRLGHHLVLWDWRLDSEPPATRDYDLALVLKGDATTPARIRHPMACYWPDQFGRDPHTEGSLDLYDRVYTMVRPTPPGMIWLPGAWEPAVHHPRPLQKTFDSVFIGTYTPRKWSFLSEMAPSAIFGNLWAVNISHFPNLLQPVYLHDYVAVLNSAKVSINIHRGEVGLNRRLFESCACTFTLTDRAPGVEELLGKELADRVAFRTPQEGREMLQHFLAHPEERESLWEAERAAIVNYTYEALSRAMLKGLT